MEALFGVLEWSRTLLGVAGKVPCGFFKRSRSSVTRFNSVSNLAIFNFSSDDWRDLGLSNNWLHQRYKVLVQINNLTLPKRINLNRLIQLKAKVKAYLGCKRRYFKSWVPSAIYEKHIQEQFGVAESDNAWFIDSTYINKPCEGSDFQLPLDSF